MYSKWDQLIRGKIDLQQIYIYSHLQVYLMIAQLLIKKQILLISSMSLPYAL
jgi:hypothetical protein